MKRQPFLQILQSTFVFTLFLLSCTPSPSTRAEEKEAFEVKTPPIYQDFKNLAPLLNKANDSVYVVNFWATWCKPCVKELPYFEELHNTYTSKKVNVLLVSLDFPDQIQSKLLPFLHERQLKSQVHVLTDGDMNSWIPKINDDWSGAIPATLIYNKERRAFYEQSFDSFEDLTQIVEPFLN